MELENAAPEIKQIVVERQESDGEMDDEVRRRRRRKKRKEEYAPHFLLSLTCVNCSSIFRLRMPLIRGKFLTSYGQSEVREHAKMNRSTPAIFANASR